MAHGFVSTICNQCSRAGEFLLNPGLGIGTMACAAVLYLWTVVPVAHGQNPQIVTCPTPGTQDLIAIPEISRTPDGVLRATIKNVDGLRTLWGSVGIPNPQPGKPDQSPTDTRCASQYVRYYVGEDTLHPKPWPMGPEPIPGPTLRARVGDLVEITFENLVNPQHFANTLDQGELGNTNGCDQVTGSRPDWMANKNYRSGASIQPRTNNPGNYFYINSGAQGGTSSGTVPNFPQTLGQTVTDGTVIWQAASTNLIYPTGGDYMPDCLHGSSTSNLHFHGTHTTPSTMGDNVLLFVHPALRNAQGIEPGEPFVKAQFAQIFSACEKNGTPTRWEQLPIEWRNRQEALLKKYDATAPYKGQPGKLPHMMQLWPPNEEELAQGLWPQFNIGAFPYCFRLTTYDQPTSPGAPPALMGQAPGTQWYHAHKHGSTALNVANGMTGALIIEGQYDDDLQKFYNHKLREQVLVLQQISSTPFPVLDATHFGNGPGAARPPISINGRRDPIVKMQPGEVQMWRIVNGAFRDAVQFLGFMPEGSTQPCNEPASSAVIEDCVNWRQIAQDGVQFDFTNYQREGLPNHQFNLSPANRADLLVKAPIQPGTYVLEAMANAGLPLQSCPNSAGLCKAAPVATYTFPLLTVKVEGNPVTPAMDFIQNQSDFPQMPVFLKDIPDDNLTRRTLVFGPGNTTINGKRFDPNKVNQAMLLNTAEEWTVKNQANDKSHPFHIHINPFQITEIFEPNSEAATTKGDPCYVNPDDPSTFRPCPSQQPQAPYVWWDTFGIPTGSQWNITSKCTNPNDPADVKLEYCPAKLKPYTKCSAAPGASCTETIPGWFKMRTRFVDYTGQYVIHCHILIHEDRGMMQLIEVVTDKTLYTHH